MCSPTSYVAVTNNMFSFRFENAGSSISVTVPVVWALMIFLCLMYQWRRNAKSRWCLQLISSCITFKVCTRPPSEFRAWKARFSGSGFFSYQADGQCCMYVLEGTASSVKCDAGHPVKCWRSNTNILFPPHLLSPRGLFATSNEAKVAATCVMCLLQSSAEKPSISIPIWGPFVSDSLWLTPRDGTLLHYLRQHSAAEA